MNTRVKPGLVLMPLLPLAIGAAITVDARRQQVQFTESELFLELNDTDGDLGIHGSIDGGRWTSLEIEGPAGRTLLSIASRGKRRALGMTQLSFEGAEPVRRAGPRRILPTLQQWLRS